MESGMVNATSSNTASTTTKKAPSNQLDKDSFLKLFVAQLKNQDPTSASTNDPNQMVQQLTSYAMLEQSQQSNTLLTGLQGQTSGLFQAQSAALVGKTVKVGGSNLNLSSGKASLSINLAAQADVTMVVKDANGKVVASLPQGSLDQGTRTLTWDGRDTSGAQMPDGIYQVQVLATDQNGKSVGVTSDQLMKVDSVTFKTDGVYLTSGSSSIPLTSVLQISA